MSSFLTSKACLFALVLSFSVSVLFAQNGSEKHDYGGSLSNRAVVDKVRPSVVQIACQLTYETTPRTSPGIERRVLGSGFLGDASGVVVTAWHVVRAMEQLRQELVASHLAQPDSPQIDPSSVRIRPEIGFATPSLMNGEFHVIGTFSTIAAELIAKDEAADIALLKLFRDPFKSEFFDKSIGSFNGIQLKPIRPVVPRFAEPAEEGDAIATSGFPLSVPEMVTTFGWIASKWHLNGSTLFQLGSIPVNHGNSGGPVYRLSDGAIIGFADAFLLASVEWPPGGTAPGGAYNSGVAVIVPIGRAVDLIRTSLKSK